MIHRSSFCLTVTFVLLLSAFCLVPSAPAQSTSATLSGTVEDQNGAVVPGATVTAENKATGLKRQAATNDEGQFTIPLLPPSTYTVTAQAQGFSPVQVSNVVLNVGDQKSLQIHLKAGNISEMVQITNDAPLIDESPAVGTVVDRQFVENLPLNGRSFQALIALTPGVVQTKASGSRPGQFSVNGQRADANYFTIDGVSANIGHSAFQGTIGNSGGSTPALTATGGTNNLVSIDALQEFKIQTSTYAPEFGRTPGAQISFVTRSGTNDFSGTLYEYFRNDALDANDWFANSRGLEKPPLRQNNFGGVLGGPLYLVRFGEGGPAFYKGKNRTFFFFSYEGQRVRQPQTGITTVPSRNSRGAAHPLARPFLNAFPVPTGPDRASGLAEFAASYSNPSSLDASSIRIDHTASDRLTFFGRFNYSPSESLSRLASSLAVLNPARYKTTTATAGTTFVFSSRLTNEIRANYSKNRILTSLTLDSFGGAAPPPDSLLFPSYTSGDESQFQFNISGAGSLASGAIVRHFQRQINLVDTLSIIAGNHQLKLGIDYRQLTPIYNPARYSVSYFAGNVTNVIAGSSPSFQSSYNEGPFNLVFHNFSAYGQDTWKVTPRLTFTYGVRWEVSPPPSEANGKNPYTVIGLDNPATMRLAPQNTPFYETTWHNFAPRIGVAYQLFQRKSLATSLRGGFGVFYDLGNGDAGGGVGGYPFRATVALSNVPIPIDFSSYSPPALKPDPLIPPYNGTILAFDPDLQLPRTYQWNASVEQSLGDSQTFTASYVGAVGRKLLRKDTFFNSSPSFPDNVISIQNLATSDYHAMQVQFQRRLSRGLQMLSSYTWSKSIDEASDNVTVNAPLTKLDPKADRGPSDFDVRQSFNIAVTYNLPTPFSNGNSKALLGGWSLDAIFTTRTATPVNVFTNRDVIGLGSFAQQTLRPDLILGVPLYLDDSTVGGGRRINRGAFSFPAGRQGTLGRNALRGFSVNQLDLSLRRRFRVTERLNFQLKAELFNALNHPNFGDPQGRLTTNGTNPDLLFGQSTQMLGRSLGTGASGGGLSPLYQIGGPRSVQLSVRLHF